MSASLISKPEVNVVINSAQAAIQNAPQKILVVAQIDDGALTGATPSSAGGGVWHQNIGNDGAENQLFGERSQAADIVRSIKLITTRVQVDLIAMTDGVAAHRTVTVTLTGTPTENGSLVVIAGSQKQAELTVAVTSGESVTVIATAIVAAVQAAPRARYWATNAAGVVTFTAINSGLVANGDPIAVIGTIAGLTIGNPATGVAGSVDPDTTNVFDVVGDERYQGIVYPYSGQADDLETFLGARFNANNAVLDGVGFIPITDTFANIGTTIATSSYNSASLVVLAQKAETAADGYFGPSIAESGIRIAAMFAAVRALRLTTGEIISRYLTSSGARDQFGGAALASLPYFNTIFPDLPTPRRGLGWTSDEITSFLTAGAAVIGQNPAGSAVIAGEVPTTYLTNGAGNADPTFHFLNYVDTASGIREYIHNNLKARFAQTRLTDGLTVAGRDMANATTIKAYLVRLYATLSGVDFALAQDGQEAVKFFKKNVVVTTDLVTGTVTITMLMPIVVQLRKINATMTIAFDTNG